MFDVRKYQISYRAQTDLVRRVILTPLAKILDLVGNMEVEERNVVWLFHPVRCGSTVWSQVFAALPNWKVISESQCMIYTLLQSRNILDISGFAKTKEFENIVLAAIKLQLNSITKGYSVFWKGIGMDEHMIPIIKKHFPSHKFLFAYRDCLPCTMSFYKAFGRLPQVMNNIYHANKEFLSGDLRKLQQNPLARHGWLTYTNGYDMQFCL